MRRKVLEVTHKAKDPTVEDDTGQASSFLSLYVCLQFACPEFLCLFNVKTLSSSTHRRLAMPVLKCSGFFVQCNHVKLMFFVCQFLLSCSELQIVSGCKNSKLVQFCNDLLEERAS